MSETARYMRLKRWIEHYFEEESQPDPRTARKAIDEGKLPGRVICGQHYVDVLRFENDADRAQPSQEPGANPDLMDRVLSGGKKSRKD